MTQEQKAKAYDEALKRAKFFHWNCPSEPERRKLEKMFPMLRESKDERIRKSLIKFLTEIKEISESGRTTWAIRKEDAEMCESFLVWLKKQKECVADNSKTSTDEDERIINQLITLVNSAGEVLLIPTNKEELVAWLNKCKESLHVPETCKENANSFTEDERIRQAIIHYILYETKGTISEATEHTWVKWLEKQKESLHIPETCEENANSFTEDERIRQWLYDLVDEGAYLCERPFATESILAYLEKQKEQKPNYCLYGGCPNVGRCRWCYADCSARLTDVHTDEEKEYVRTIKSIISDFIRDKKPENLAYYQRIYDWLDGRYVPFSCGQLQSQGHF